MPQYFQLLLMAAALFFALTVVKVVGLTAQAMLPWGFSLPVSFLLGSIDIYAWIVLCRMTGMLYFHKRRQLGWYRY